MAGTPAYLAPEFSRTDLPPHLLQRSDIYALGVIAYEMLTGEPPYDIVTTAGHADGARRRRRRCRAGCARSSARRSTRRCSARCASTRCSARHRPTSSAAQLLRARESIKAHARGRSRILVADDDSDFLALARETLAFGFPGARIETVRDGDAALAAIDREPAALAVIDLDMPGMNGVELTAALRANYSMPIVVCTASGGAPDWRLLSVARRRRLPGQADRPVRADRARPQDARQEAR